MAFFCLDEDNNPTFQREFVHKTAHKIDNYIEYKGLEILFGHDEFLHLYYKGQKSDLKLVRGKYFSSREYFNKGKKVFRRGQFLFYPGKYNQGMQGPFITLMRLDLEILIQQVRSFYKYLPNKI